MQLFTSESVTAGHPDKVCDQISDAILDAYLQADSQSKVAVETLAAGGRIVLAGEVSSAARIDPLPIARKTLQEIGYVDEVAGFDGANCEVLNFIGAQSPEINAGVTRSLETRSGATTEEYDTLGAGDQGIMFGYATDETPELMPPAIAIAHRLTRKLHTVRQNGDLPWLLPDGKAQVTLGLEGGYAKCIESVVLSTQHTPEVTQGELAKLIAEYVIDPVLDDSGLVHRNVTKFINPAGAFTLGGPAADAGLTGRKIIVDTYGGAARHGGGAFSGKDPSKVDRSAAYAMRWVAKNIVAAQLAQRVEVQVAYAIGRAAPVGLYVDTFGTGVASDQALARAVREVFDLRPAALIDALQLQRPIYRSTAAYGHFGRDEVQFTWEATNRAAALREIVLR